MESYQYQSIAKVLKKNAIERILVQMIEDIKIGDPSEGRADVPFLILILDEYTAKIVSAFVSMSDVLNKGVFSVEKLEIARRKFPNYQALYFIAPVQSSVEYLIKDFEDKNNPQYKKIHIFFSHEVMDSTINQLVTEKIYPRIATCKELNLSFICRNKNLFELGMQDFLDIFSAKFDKVKENIKTALLSERLFTVCSVLNEYPYIQYQKSSYLCYELALGLNSRLKQFYSAQDGPRVNLTRGLMLITDRTLDICTPLLHDYCYEALLYDLLKPEEFVLKSNDEKIANKTIELDDNDEVWNKYKNSHIAEVFEKMSKEASDFCNMIKSKDNDKEGKSGQKSHKEFDEMRQVLREAKGLKLKSDIFNFHIESCQTLGARLQKYDISNLIDYEQDIITGVNKNGDKVELKDIFTRYTVLNLSKQDLDIRTRIILMILINLDLKENELNRLVDGDPNIKKAVDNLTWFGIGISKSKSKNPRREPTKSKQEIKKSKEKNNEMEFVGLRSKPKLESLVENWSNLELSPSEYPFIEEPKNLGVYRKKLATGVFIKSNNNSDEEKPNFILFNIGGLSHNEITVLEKLSQDKKISQNLIIGTDKIITANDYVNAIKNLPVQSLDQGQIELKYK